VQLTRGKWHARKTSVFHWKGTSLILALAQMPLQKCYCCYCEVLLLSCSICISASIINKSTFLVSIKCQQCLFTQKGESSDPYDPLDPPPYKYICSGSARRVVEILRTHTKKHKVTLIVLISLTCTIPLINTHAIF